MSEDLIDEELSGEELLEKWQDQEKVWNFEGSTKNLNKICKVIGYRDDMFGSALENFLNDNSGAQTEVRDWIAKWIDRNKEWRELVEAEIVPVINGEEEEEE